MAIGTFQPVELTPGSTYSNPKISDVDTPTTDSIRLHYDQEVKHTDPGSSDDALNLSNYALAVSGGISRTITGVSLYQANPTIVTLNLDGEMTNGASYTVTVSNVENLAGLVMDPDYDEYTFNGYGIRPVIDSVSVPGSQAIQITFSELMHKNTDLTNASNYTFTGSLVASSVTVFTEIGGKTTVLVSLSTEMLDGASYIVTVNNVEDLAWNSISPTGNSASFTGVGDKPQVLPDANPIDPTHVRIEYNEQVDSTALNTTTYTLDPVIAVSAVAKVINDVTYELTLATDMARGIDYTIYVDNSVKDLAGNTLDPAHDEATFTGIGVSPPEIVMTPESGTDDWGVRKVVSLQIYDPTLDFTGIDVSSIWITENGNRVINPGDLTLVGGSVEVTNPPAFYNVTVLGNPNDSNGITINFIPKTNWLPSTRYDISAYAQDNEGTPNDNQSQGYFQTATSECFEDQDREASELDSKIMASFSSSNIEKVRQVLLNTCSFSPSLLSRARTLENLAYLSSAGMLLAGAVDETEIRDVKICEQRSILDIYNELLKYRRVILNSVNELGLSSGAKDLMWKLLASDSPVTVVSAVATMVVVGAVNED